MPEIEFVGGGLLTYEDDEIVRILYCNHKGDIAWRRICPDRIERTETKWHPLQFILEAMDLDKRDYRSFAMRDIHCWLPESRAQQLGEQALEMLKVSLGPVIHYLSEKEQGNAASARGVQE